MRYTLPEQAVYDALEHLGVPFKRQEHIGPYIVDVYLPTYKAILEVDGPNHRRKDKQLYDQSRSEDLLTFGIATLRMSNEDAVTAPVETIRELLFMARVFGIVPEEG